MILGRQAALGAPTFPVILSLLRVLLECFAAILSRSPIHGTHFRTSRNVFENPSAPDEPTPAWSGNVHARRLTATHGEPMTLKTGRCGARVNDLEKSIHNLAISTARFARKF